MKKIGIGIIGCGNIINYYLKQLLRVDGCRVVAACDVNPYALQIVREQAGLPKNRLFSDYKRLVKQDDVEAVMVCVPNKFHSPVSIEALEAGKHVFCEKPMAMNLPEAKKMIEIAEKSGRRLLIGLENRFECNSQVLKRHVDDGELGEIYYAKCGFLRRSGIPGWGSWFTRRRDAGSGALFDIGVHILDLTFWLMSNFKPAAAYASTYAKFGPEKKGLGDWGKPEFEGYFDVEELATSLITMENGATVFFEASWATHISKDVFYSTLMGEKAGGDLESASIFTTELEGLVDKKLSFNVVDAYFVEMKHFVDCILEDKEPLTRPEEMLGLQRALDMILKSSLEKKIVSSAEVVGG